MTMLMNLILIIMAGMFLFLLVLTVFAHTPLSFSPILRPVIA